MSIALTAPNIETSQSVPAPVAVTVRGGKNANPARAKGHKQAPIGLAKANADLVLRAFNTWAYKRQQPDNVEILQRDIETAIAARKPVEFCLYWGKGPRNNITHAEIECLDYLKSMGERIAAVFEPGARFTLIFTDTHARLNGHSNDAISHYVEAVRQAAEERGFKSCFLGDLVAQAEAAGCEPAPVPLHLLDKLSVTAAKWYRGGGSVELGALRYLEMNMIEKRAVEHAFTGATFVTFNGGEMRDLFPDNMAIFYMYSVRRGVAVKPWFIEEASAIDKVISELPVQKMAVAGGAQ